MIGFKLFRDLASHLGLINPRRPKGKGPPELKRLVRDELNRIELGSASEVQPSN